MLEDLQVIWNVLHGFREDCISQKGMDLCGMQVDDELWDDICTAMAHIHEALEINQEDIE